MIIPFKSHNNHDHADCIHAALEQADTVCAANGSRLTRVRRRVLELVWQRHAPIGAYEILEHLVRDGGNPAPPTVYRALEFLISQGLVHRVETLNAYVGCSKPGTRHNSIFLICVQCGTTVEVQDRTTGTFFDGLATAHGYDLTHVCAEAMGRCDHCQQPGPKQHRRSLNA